MYGTDQVLERSLVFFKFFNTFKIIFVKIPEIPPTNIEHILTPNKVFTISVDMLYLLYIQNIDVSIQLS